MDIKEKVGARIKHFRQEPFISQENLANKADIERTYMNEVENGKRNISIEKLEKILNALGVTFKEFFDSTFFTNNK